MSSIIPWPRQLRNYSKITNLLLTEREGSDWEILARGRANRDRAQRDPYKNDRGQYSPVRIELARLVSSLLYDTRAVFVLNLPRFRKQKIHIR